ncbi:DNA repair protein RecN [Halomonadaceae bacterium LMG 33818]|uniref:DNA repair protein RecN n=1 Tax=Cernens ardua TaxID=3402176 RepID=UPI003EDC9602
MLTQLTIRNYVIVDHLELDFRQGMTAITGETGAGKSILLDALSLCLGGRYEAGSVKQGEEKAELSACFDVSRLPAAQAWLNARELEADTCILRRVITSSGRSKAWINGSPCTLADLKALSDHLIDIHAQHAHQSLLREQQHQALLDEYAGIGSDVEKLSQIYHRWSKARQRLKTAQQTDSEANAKRQLLRYQVEELDELALQEGELEQLEHEQTQLAHAEQAQMQTQQALNFCDDDEQGATTLIAQARQALESLPELNNPAIASALALLSEAGIQLDEASSELSHYLNSAELDPERLNQVESRLASVHQIARKHHIMPEEIISFAQHLRDQLAQLEPGEEDLEALTQEVRQLRDDWRTLAQSISQQRYSHATTLAQRIQEQLVYLGMEKSCFEVSVTQRDAAHPEGMDHVTFLFSANPGQPPRPLHKVASGGELSRISLAIQVVAAAHSTIPTLVFDEVDVGISGATAEIVGQLLRELGQTGAQLLCITHLPQVAAQAHQHLHIEKQKDDTSTHTHMALLDESGRIRELARMLGGIHLSERTLAHAHEMLQGAQQPAQH